MLKNNGFSLLEVIIAEFILMCGLLSFMGFGVLSLKRTQDAYYHALAINQITNLVEQFSVSDFDCFNWKKKTMSLFPQPTINCQKNLISICWLEKSGKKACEEVSR